MSTIDGFMLGGGDVFTFGRDVRGMSCPKTCLNLRTFPYFIPSFVKIGESASLSIKSLIPISLSISSPIIKEQGQKYHMAASRLRVFT